MPDVVSGGRASERNSSQFPKPIHRRLGGRSRRAKCPKQDRVRAREHPSRSASSRRDRVRPSGGRDMNPNALLAGARGRAVRAPTGLGLRQGFPPCLRRLPRPRRPALRRRVQRSLQRRRGPAGTSPARAATVAPAALRRFRGRLAPRAHRRAACLAAEQPLTAALPLARTLGESDRKASPATTPPARPTTGQAGRARQPSAAALVLRATRGRCWLSVRQRSEQGRDLFEGTLEPGESRRFAVGSGSGSAPPGTWTRALPGARSRCRRRLQTWS